MSIVTVKKQITMFSLKEISKKIIHTASRSTAKQKKTEKNKKKQ
jgi:hypothetical protein